MGGTPVDLGSAYQLIDNTTQSVLAVGVLFGLGNAYPSLNATINKHLNAKGVKVRQAITGRNYCIAGNANDPIIVPASIETLVDTPPTSISDIANVINGESLLMNVTTRGPIPVPKYPRLQYHGSNDTTVPYNTELQYVEQQCAKGADIRFVTFAGQVHGPTAIQGFLGALSFVPQSLNGVLPAAKCGRPTVPVIAPGSSAAVQLLNQTLSDLYSKLIGKNSWVLI